MQNDLFIQAQASFGQIVQSFKEHALNGDVQGFLTLIDVENDDKAVFARWATAYFGTYPVTGVETVLLDELQSDEDGFYGSFVAEFFYEKLKPVKHKLVFWIKERAERWGIVKFRLISELEYYFQRPADNWMYLLDQVAREKLTLGKKVRACSKQLRYFASETELNSAVALGTLFSERAYAKARELRGINGITTLFNIYDFLKEAVRVSPPPIYQNEEETRDAYYKLPYANYDEIFLYIHKFGAGFGICNSVSTLFHTLMRLNGLPWWQSYKIKSNFHEMGLMAVEGHVFAVSNVALIPLEPERLYWNNLIKEFYNEAVFCNDQGVHNLSTATFPKVYDFYQSLPLFQVHLPTVPVDANACNGGANQEGPGERESAVRTEASHAGEWSETGHAGKWAETGHAGKWAETGSAGKWTEAGHAGPGYLGYLDYYKGEQLFCQLQACTHPIVELARYTYQTLLVENPEVYIQQGFQSQLVKEKVAELGSVAEILEFVRCPAPIEPYLEAHRVLTGEQVLRYGVSDQKSACILGVTLLSMRGYEAYVYIAPGKAYIIWAEDGEYQIFDPVSGARPVGIAVDPVFMLIGPSVYHCPYNGRIHREGARVLKKLRLMEG